MQPSPGHRGVQPPHSRKLPGLPAFPARGISSHPIFPSDDCGMAPSCRRSPSDLPPLNPSSQARALLNLLSVCWLLLSSASPELGLPVVSSSGCVPRAPTPASTPMGCLVAEAQPGLPVWLRDFSCLPPSKSTTLISNMLEDKFAEFPKSTAEILLRLVEVYRVTW